LNIVTEADALITCLYIIGFGKTEALSETLGEPVEAIEAGLAALVSDGAAEQTRVGVRLSAKGKARAQDRLAAERAAVDPERLEREYERFSALNSDFKPLVTAWQMREIDGKPTRNDHKDEVYDADVLARLPPLMRRPPPSSTMSGSMPRASAPKSAGLRTRSPRSKDHRYITAPDRDSYHTIWFELHQHLINLLGVKRAQEAAAGRAL
jgi:pyruvate,orthophosphate dikinase